MIDYHIHTARCGHAEGEMAAYVERAVSIGLREMGFADHLPLLTGEDPTLTMSMSELAGYIEEVAVLRAATPALTIKTGIEADFFPGHEAETGRLLGAHPFDYVIGSIHFIGGWGFDDSRYLEGYSGRDIYELYEEHFGLVARAATSDLFDVLGHFDLIKKYNFRPDRDITPLIEETLSAIKDAGACIEINTAGLRKPVGEIYPSEAILSLCARVGVPITLGSDAHKPDEVGMGFEVALAMAHRSGYRELAAFDKRERYFMPIA
jgi:histidinol-phosphatase (PHP family)